MWCDLYTFICNWPFEPTNRLVLQTSLNKFKYLFWCEKIVTLWPDVNVGCPTSHPHSQFCLTSFQNTFSSKNLFQSENLSPSLNISSPPIWIHSAKKPLSSSKHRAEKKKTKKTYNQCRLLSSCHTHWNIAHLSAQKIICQDGESHLSKDHIYVRVVSPSNFT